MKLSNKGFTLSELLLAAAILAFVLSGLLLLFINCIILNEANRNLSVATSHAQYIMEEIKNAGTLQSIKAKIDSGNFTSFQVLPNENITVCCCNSPCSSCLGSCQSAGDPLGIYVRVNWKDRSVRDRYIELKTQMTDY